jgi:CO/xanthine dehydrogenase Mo-binding subunit
MGQGVHDGLVKILADELDADWSSVRIRLPWADKAFVSPVIKRQRTANSDSTIGYFQVLREVGAAAREMLVAAAAQRWAVPVADCRSALSRVTHLPTGRQFSYGELAAQAATLPVPAKPTLKTPEQFSLIGKPSLRKDTPPKVDGSAVFGIDVRMDGMLYAVLCRSPAVSSKLVSFERDSILRLPGVVDAFAVSDGVAVVAKSTWQARQAADKLVAQFDTAASKEVEQAQIRTRLKAALDNDAAAGAGRPAFGGGPFDKAATLAALAAAPVRKEWTYEVPFLAHAALEPLNATALVRDDSAEVWAPTQQPDTTADMVAQVTGFARERCRLNVTFLGGGFGRKFETDFVKQAVEVANKMRNRPVKLIWTREQDFRHDRYRPAHMARSRVGLDKNGNILAMHSRITGISMWRYKGRTLPPGSGDPFATGGLINDRYAIANAYVDTVATDEPIPVGTWRSVSQSMNCFFFESAIEDIAATTRQDSLALRKKLLAKDSRAIALLDKLAAEGNWGKPMPKGQGRGLAFSLGFGSYCGQIFEVAVRGKDVHISRIVCVFDCGLMIDPHFVEAQVVGGIVWGLSAARDGQITFANGGAVESNFHNAPILRISEMPAVEVHLLAGDVKPGGAGEASVPPAAPALASAIFAATGKRPRRLPLSVDGYRFV